MSSGLYIYFMQLESAYNAGRSNLLPNRWPILLNFPASPLSVADRPA